MPANQFKVCVLRGERLRRMVAGAERWLMRRFGVVSTISQRMHQRLLDKGVDAAKARLAVNWVDVAAFGGGLRPPGRINSALQGAPVIASPAAGSGQAKARQSMTPCGLVVPPEDALAFANAVLRLAADPALRERLGAAGYAYAQAHLDREAVLAKFEAELFGLL